MTSRQSGNVSLVSQWFIRQGCVEQVLAALPAYVQQVMKQEPGTLIYLVNTPQPEGGPGSALQSLPPAIHPSLLFFEEYASEDAFLAHVKGAAFSRFVDEYGQCFISSDGRPYTTVTFLHRQQGFVRGQDGQASQAEQLGCQNRHPAVMFEIIARDQDQSKAFLQRSVRLALPKRQLRLRLRPLPAAIARVAGRHRPDRERRGRHGAWA